MAQGNIHSHIQIPKSILLHFRDESDPEKKVWFLDISTGEIHKKPAKRLGTSIGYYSKDIELFWQQHIESPLGELNKKVRSFCDGNMKTMIITADDADLAKKYIKSAVVRSRSAYRTMKEYSATACLFTEQQNHDVMSLIGMNTPSPFDQLLSGASATVLANRTDRSLVVPQNCYYCVPRKNTYAIIAPISPRSAFLFMPTETIAEEDGVYAVVDDPKQIEEMNVYALKYEYMFAGEFVASNCWLELKSLQDFRRKNHIELELLKQ